MIIDFHVHVFPDKIANKAISQLASLSGVKPFTDGTITDTLKKIKECKVDKAVLLNIATKPAQMETINDEAIRVNKKYKEFISFGSVHPDREEALDELVRIKENGIKGIKLHPDYQGFFVEDKKLYPIYERCSQLSLPIVLHTGYDCYSPKLVHAHPLGLKKVAKLFPDTKFVFAHMGSLSYWDQVEEMLVGLPNVYFDTSFSVNGGLDKDQAKRIIDKHYKENILFGSDCPWDKINEAIDFIESLDLSDDLKEAIFFRNAKRLLKEE